MVHALYILSLIKFEGHDEELWDGRMPELGGIKVLNKYIEMSFYALYYIGVCLFIVSLSSSKANNYRNY